MSSKKYGNGLFKMAKALSVKHELTPRLIESFLSSLDSPRALAVWLMFKNHEHDQLAALKFDPLHYNGAEDTRRAYFATKYLSKFDSLNLTVDKETAAYAKFQLFEEQCGRTNNRFKFGGDPGFTPDLVALHHAVRRKIHQILGDFCPEDWVQSCSWGPGATSTLPRRYATSTRKFQSQTGITRDLYALLPISLFGKAYPLWMQDMVSRGGESTYGPINPFTFLVGNKVVTVPKDSSIDRIIAIEPALNLWFQKGIGEIIGRKLLKVGVNLRNQGINGELARQGSISGGLATVDLSSASDSISTELVRELLPADWFSVMDSCRSHYGFIRNEWVKWNKFSSMGNGFTFQLESLIFFACAKAACDHTGAEGRVSVYGDDVILPTSAYTVFSELLSAYGFSINEAKSYSYTWFRESCGQHWFKGMSIKPAYLKSKLSSLVDIYQAANTIRRLSHRSCASMACDKIFKKCFDLLFYSVPKPLRLQIPETLGDGGFISNWDEATPHILRLALDEPSHEGFKVRNFVTKVALSHDDSVGYLLNRLWSMPKKEPSRLLRAGPTILGLGNTEFIGRLPALLTSEPGLEFQGYNSIPTRDLQLRLSKSIVRQWYDLGPWI